MRLRPEVQWFAEQMEKRLGVNDHKGGWDHCDDDYLFIRLQEETEELRDYLFIRPYLTLECPDCHHRQVAENNTDDIDELIAEAADVANFAMMIADVHNRSRAEISDKKGPVGAEAESPNVEGQP